MDNFQFWLYVIVAVIYLISRARKKSQEQPEPQDEVPEIPSRPVSRSYEEAPTQRPKPVTFEELLREITEGKEVKPEARREPEYVDYDDEIEEEEKSLETISPINEERTTQIYEEAKKLAFYRPSLEETMKLADTDTKYGKFAEFEIRQERNLLLEYAQDLRDPKRFKKALILSEILNRKHF